MKFKLEIALDNEALHNEDGPDRVALSDLLSRVAGDVVERGSSPLSLEDGQKVHDTNGNAVGFWRIARG